jgi:hypothetical protein
MPGKGRWRELKKLWIITSLVKFSLCIGDYFFLFCILIGKCLLNEKLPSTCTILFQWMVNTISNWAAFKKRLIISSPVTKQRSVKLVSQLEKLNFSLMYLFSWLVESPFHAIR